jgi:cytidyltransferase-like protein
VINSLQLEIIKQIFASQILDRDTKIDDFNLYIEREKILSNLNDLIEQGFVVKSDLHNSNVYKLTNNGREKITVVLTGGAYDLLHTGHITTLKEASNHGDFLLVVVAKDSTVEGRKRTPIHSEEQRMSLLNELKVVDLAVIGNKIDHMAIVRKARPDIIAIGSDQDHRIKMLESQLLDEKMGNTKLVRLSSNLEGLSTSEVITEILERFV